MKSLTDLIGGLPGVRPRKARTRILDDDMLSKAERADIRYGDDPWDLTLEVGPDAAAAILAAYQAGRLPMKPGAVPAAAPYVEAYLARRVALLAMRAEQDRRRRATKDPSLVREVDFLDDRFLDTLFFQVGGKGGGMLVLDGIAVTKTLAPYSTNSGKNTGWGVTFHWIGSDGVSRSSGRIPSEATNRRNDSERDHGLPDG